MTAAALNIDLPHQWEARDYQRPFWNHMIRDGGKRACVVWHRRAGKDTATLHIECALAMQRAANYWHMFPVETQARRAMWKGVNPHTGKRVLHEVFPPELIAKQNEQMMSLELINGAIWNLVGSDNFDRLVGSPPAGVVFSEYALANPAAWDFIRPILLENGGWAVFIYTPRGHNHGYRLYEMARQNPDWFCQHLTVEDTGVITPEQIESERAEGMSEANIQQEYYCSFDAPVEGAYYADLMIKADQENRITSVPHEAQLPVETWWDLGIGDAMAIWFVQRHGAQIRLIRYYEMTGMGLDHYVNMLWRLRDDEGYLYGDHIAPHDIRVRELGTGTSRLEAARGMGLEFKVAPQLPVDDGINAVRGKLNNCWFDEAKCLRGIDALRNYRKEEDENKSDGVVKFYKPKPLHDWASHGSDAARYGITGGGRGPLSREPIKYLDRGAPL